MPSDEDIAKKDADVFALDAGAEGGERQTETSEPGRKMRSKVMTHA